MTTTAVTRTECAEVDLIVRWQDVRTGDIVVDVQAYVLTAIQDSAAFGETGDGRGTRGADVSIERPAS